MFNSCYLIFLLVFFSCTNERKNNSSDSINKQEIPLDIKILKSITYPEAIKKYGPPKSQEEFILDNSLPEFRIELYNFFSDDEIRDSIGIKEATWRMNSTENITVWYKIKPKLNPVHALVWDIQADF